MYCNVANELTGIVEIYKKNLNVNTFYKRYKCWKEFIGYGKSLQSGGPYTCQHYYINPSTVWKIWGNWKMKEVNTIIIAAGTLFCPLDTNDFYCLFTNEITKEIF